MAPRRLQRKRQPGHWTPIGAIYCGRPTIWGNPFIIGEPHPHTNLPMTRYEVIALYEQALLAGELPFTVAEAVRDLGGRDLVCWCGLDEACHVDILLRVANDRPDRRTPVLES